MMTAKITRWSGLAAALGGLLFIFLAISATRIDEYTILGLATLLMFLSWGIALFGLYLLLPAASQPARGITLVAMLTSLIVTIVGLIILPYAEIGFPLILWGYIGFGLSIAGMGIIGYIHHILGSWRFVPLLLAICWLIFIATYMQTYSVEHPLQFTFTLLTGVGWLVLGTLLWQTNKAAANTPQLA